MKKVLKIIGKGLIALLILIVLFLLVMFIYHRVMLKKEDKLLKDYPGELVEVNGHNMNVYVNGKGKHTLVFLAAAGQTSPVITFKPLYSKLEDDYRVVVIEKFGYGMSDIIGDKRDYETMVNEMREALNKLNIEGPYILCPYSKSGIDTLIWQQNYPEEVEAIISLDMAFPESFKELDISTGGAGLISFVRNSGLIRLFISDSDISDIYSKDDKSFIKALFYRKYANKVFLNEMETVKDAAKSISNKEKPAMPMYLFMSNGEGTGNDEEKWQGYAYSYIGDNKNISITKYNSSHDSIIDDNYEDIVNNIKKFTTDIDK